VPGIKQIQSMKTKFSKRETAGWDWELEFVCDLMPGPWSFPEGAAE
jgi:hypothetical protein